MLKAKAVNLQIAKKVILVNGIILCRKMAKKNVVFPTYFFAKKLQKLLTGTFEKGDCQDNYVKSK